MSKLIESRQEFQELAARRLTEAKVLLDLGLWDGAYYLAGYAVELALKACIIKLLMATDEFPDKEFSRNCYTHDLKQLVKLARLSDAWDLASGADPDLKENWESVRFWSEEKRYHRTSQSEAEVLYAAIADDTHGVLTWIKTHW